MSQRFLLQNGLRAQRTPVSLPQSKATTHHTVTLRAPGAPQGPNDSGALTPAHGRNNAR
jgi:hypothetical protein